MDIDKIFNQLKEELLGIFNNSFKDLKGEAKKDLEEFLAQSEEKLRRWTLLLASGDITQDEFAWLVKSQKDLMLFHTLYATGVSKIKLGHFKNKVIKTIISTIIALI